MADAWDLDWPRGSSGVLIIEVVFLVRGATAGLGAGAIEPKEIGIALFGPYLIGVELASMLLLAGLVGAYHLGSHDAEKPEIRHDADTHERRADASRDLVLAGTNQPARTS